MTVDPFTQLRAALTAEPSRRQSDGDRAPRGIRAAAVLFLLTQETDPAATFVTRASAMRQHAGQIALPGGAVDPTDKDHYATALREAHEEIGLDPGDVSIMGKLPALWVAASGYDVTPVIASWPGKRALAADNTAETAAIHTISVSELSNPANRFTATHPSGYAGPGFLISSNFIWGLTAHLIDWVLALAGWQQDWDRSYLRPVPDNFL